ncbi:tetratricopeptide repeat protein [Ruminococcus sp.]|uniref:tetratricopeptide repeat protein n=1 Tax=Ruminococcus sp. TaxID=41978 RepID=UPI003AF67F3B
MQEVDERADIYAIGHILFEKVMERNAKISDIILGKKFNLEKTKLLKNSSPQLREKIQEIFQHTVVRMKSERYSNTDELIKTLDQALKIATEEKDGYLIDNNITVTTSSNYYISRKDKLSEIRQHLENYHIAYLYGIGGIGKSETAREYAEEYRDSYTTIQLSVYSGDLKALIAGLKFSSDDKTGDYFEKDINIRYETKLSLLSKAMINNEKTLLIIDNYNVEPDSDEYKKNVEVMKDLKKLHIHILFTTRTSPNDDKTKIDIEELSKEELRHMFFAINPKDKDKEERIAQVDELIETAYSHTLTVDLVAHQTVKIEEYNKRTLSEYITVLKKSGMNSGINVAVDNNKDGNGKSTIVFEHIKALFNLSSLTDKERYIMVNACLLPLSGMPVAEFETFIDLENHPDSESSDGWGEDSTITNLVKSGWMKRIDNGVSRIALHPLVAEVVANELQPKITENKCQKFCDSMQELADNCENDLKAVEPYKDLFIKSANLLMKSEDEKTANYLSSVSYVLFNLAYYVDALIYMLKTLVIREETLPENHPDIASSLNNVGCAYGKLGGDKGYEIECKYCLKALAIREKVLPENHPDIATSLNNIGYAYCELGDPKEALKYLLKALTIREKVLPKNHPDIAESLNNVGSAYGKLGKHDKVFEYKKRALVIWNNELLKNHTECAAPFHHIGVIYGELKCYRKQLEYFNKALTIQEKKLSKNHPEIALLYNNISATYMCLRNYDKALPYMLKAASIFEQTVPKNNAQLARLYSRISKAYANLEDEENSEKYLKLYQQYNDQ